MPPVTWYTLKLTDIIHETAACRRFIFQIISDFQFHYTAGQFLTCDLPTGEKRAQRWRSYSIANIENKENQIEFCISYKPEGIASEYFFNQIKIGDEIKCKGPEGNFVLPELTDLNLFLICTGTGIAPFRPMLQQMLKQSHPYESVHLVFGIRKQEDILYRNEIEIWNQHISGFKSHICLSRELLTEPINPLNSNYYSGYVHTAYKKILEESDYPKNSCNFMLCGWSEMIDQAVQIIFLESKFNRDQIRFELYG